MLAPGPAAALLPEQRTECHEGGQSCTGGRSLFASLCRWRPTLPAAAEDYPSRPIRAIASQGPGGLSDLFMRALADQLGPALGTSIVVEDRVGADGTIGAKACAEAAPDGYTICILPGETITINPIIHPDSDFDPAKAWCRSPEPII